MSGSDSALGTCSLCDEPAVEKTPVTNEETGEVSTGRFCEIHLEKLERYNSGEEVDWSEESA